MTDARQSGDPEVVLFYDLGSPYGYLAAARIEGLLGRAVEFRPILLGGIFQQRGWGSWAQTDARAEGIGEVETRAARYGLPPIVWPDPWPGNGLFVMRAAVVAGVSYAGFFGVLLAQALRGQSVLHPDAVTFVMLAAAGVIGAVASVATSGRRPVAVPAVL